MDFNSSTQLFSAGWVKRHGENFRRLLNKRGGKRFRRIQNRMDWHYPVDALTDVCVADGCNGQYVTDPLKRHDLRRLFPTICRTCGAVLTPIRLWRHTRSIVSKLPDRPFLTQSFSPRGGGIDFLGMRAVNLRMLQEFLIPGINNATADFGTYCLATWIPWKFRQLAKTKEKFTYSQYREFREAIEIAIAFSQRPGSAADGSLEQRVHASVFSRTWTSVSHLNSKM